jgi:short-subunit dehydrogenase
MNVIVTGATKGIGRAIAEKFASAGNKLIVCARNHQELHRLSGELETKNPGCIVKTRPVDMSKKEQVQEFGQWIINLGITPDVIVNNAGGFVPGSVYDEEDGNLEKMMAINLYSAYHFTRMLLPSMIAVKTGHIFNMCSLASLTAYPNGAAYSISKFAMLGFSKNLREEMKPHGIKVTAVCPGATMSASWEGFDIDPHRIMEANDIAEMVYAATRLSPTAVVEDIIIRPQPGDL